MPSTIRRWCLWLEEKRNKRKEQEEFRKYRFFIPEWIEINQKLKLSEITVRGCLKCLTTKMVSDNSRHFGIVNNQRMIQTFLGVKRIFIQGQRTARDFFQCLGIVVSCTDLIPNARHSNWDPFNNMYRIFGK